MNRNTVSWIFQNGSQSVDCASFPYAFRAMLTTVKKGIEAKKPVDTSELFILGPKNARGERRKYSYSAAGEMATNMGLLLADGTLYTKEFKKRP